MKRRWVLSILALILGISCVPKVPPAPRPASRPPEPASSSSDCDAAGLNSDPDFCYVTESGSGSLKIARNFGAIFQMEDYLTSCRDIFTDAYLLDTLIEIARWGTQLSHDEMSASFNRPQPQAYIPVRPWKDFQTEGLIRGALWKTISHVTEWRHVNIDVGDENTIVNAEIVPLPSDTTKAEIRLYGTACAPRRIYGRFGLEDFDRFTRYMFITAHEFGHVMDFLAGRTRVLGKSSSEIERRATVYASYLMECWLRIMETSYSAPSRTVSALPKELKPVVALPFKDPKEQRCAVTNWRRLEKGMAARRKEWSALPFPDADLMRPAACQSPRQ